MGRRKIAVLMGGPSVEREISLASGQAVLADLLARGRSALPVVMDRDGAFRLGRTLEPGDLPAFLEHPELDDAAPMLRAVLPPIEGALALRDHEVEAVFIALHGDPGEDGSLQAIFDWGGVPYTGAGPVSSVLALDKSVTKALLRDAGLPTPASIRPRIEDWRADRAGVIARGLAGPGLPAAIKPCDQGSSVGMSMVRDREGLEDALDLAFEHASAVLWEAFVTGTELTCPVIGRAAGELEALPVIEIVPRASTWFDYTSKYASGGAEEICPARIPAALAREMQELAMAAHRLIGCDGLSRTDAIATADGLRFLEINTIPGMTPASLVPKAAAVCGMGFSGVVDRLIALGIERARPSAAAPA